MNITTFVSAKFIGECTIYPDLFFLGHVVQLLYTVQFTNTYRETEPQTKIEHFSSTMSKSSILFEVLKILHMVCFNLLRRRGEECCHIFAPMVDSHLGGEFQCTWCSRCQPQSHTDHSLESKVKSLSFANRLYVIYINPTTHLFTKMN